MSLTLGGRGEEVLVLVNQAKEGVSSGQVLLRQLDHTVSLVFKLRMRVGDVLDVDSLRRREGSTSIDIGIRVRDEIF